MIMGSWIIPLITSYIPHNPAAGTRSRRRILFRGECCRSSRSKHLYHLEHHLYPMVPHQNWPILAKRLDPYFKKAGVEARVLDFEHRRER